ncbi:MAG: DUF6242 domain-containing protein [Phocaeicola sp.]
MNFFTVVTLFVTLFLVSSCLGTDNNEYTYSSNASLTAFSIDGDITTSYPGITASGEDTTYTVTVTGSDYPFVIDQINRQIYPVDSLPVGTDVSKVVVSITGDTSYILMEREEKTDTLWTSTDSLNFENPIIFKVVSETGKYGAPYTAKINVHKQDPDSMHWAKIEGNFPSSSFESTHKAIYFKNRIYVFANFADQVKVTSAATSNANSWSELVAVNIPEVVDYESVMVWNDKVYLLAGGQLYSSSDVMSWTKEENAPTLRMLVASTSSSIATQKLVGVALDNHFVEADKTLQTWEKKEQVSERFPKKSLSYASYALVTNSSIDRMIAFGDNGLTSSSDTIISVWSKLSTDQSWGEYTPVAGYTYCPKMENPAMIHYNNRLYSFGGQAVRADTTFRAMEQFFVSENHGVNWSPIKTKVTFPKEFMLLYSQANGNYSYVVDENNYLWILFSNSSTVWRGRINKLGFSQK